MTETISIDGGGDQRREAAGDEEDGPETRFGRASYARAKGFRESFQLFAREYI